MRLGMQESRVRLEKMEHFLVSSLLIYFVLSIIIPDYKKLWGKIHCQLKIWFWLQKSCVRNYYFISDIVKYKKICNAEEKVKQIVIFCFLKNFEIMTNVDKLWFQLKVMYRKLNLIWNLATQSMWPGDEQHWHHQGAS